MLHVENVTARYGDAIALDRVSLHVDAGEVVGIFGRNGAGKSTLLKVLAGLHPCAAGTISFADLACNDRKAHRVARAGLSLVREGAPMPGSLTVLENLLLGQRAAGLRGVQPRGLDEVWEMFPLLVQMKSARAGYLSGGQRQALALAVAFAAQPTLLLLDEPSAGLAPKITSELFETIAKLAQTGTAALIVEQNPVWLSSVSERNYVLDLGVARPEGGGTPEAIESRVDATAAVSATEGDGREG